MTHDNSEHRRHENGVYTHAFPLPFAEGAPEAMRSLFEQSTKLQSEMMTLWSHRAQAWLNLPKQVLACKNPGDLADAQGAFVMTMQRHYKEYYDSMLQGTPATQGRRNGKDDESLTDSGLGESREERQSHREAA